VELPPTVTLSLWLTLLGMFAAFILGGAGITVLYHVLVRQRDPARDAGIAAFAKRLGLSYSAVDPFDLLRLPFELIRTGGQAMILNVVSGEFRGMALTAFEYRRFSRERVGDKERPWAFSCVMAALPISASEVVIERQSADAFQLGRSISRAPQIQTESVEFDRAFAVHARDPRFALSLLDPAVMGWFLTSPGDWNFEFYGSRLLCYSPLREVGQVEALITTMRDLHDRIPAVARDFAASASTATDMLRRGSLAGEPRPRRSIRVSSILVWSGVLLFLAGLVAVALYVNWSAAKGAL
jgi:hypothetical protein